MVSVDRLPLAEEITRDRPELLPPVRPFRKEELPAFTRLQEGDDGVSRPLSSPGEREQYLAQVDIRDGIIEMGTEAARAHGIIP